MGGICRRKSCHGFIRFSAQRDPRWLCQPAFYDCAMSLDFLLLSSTHHGFACRQWARSKSEGAIRIRVCLMDFVLRDSVYT